MSDAALPPLFGRPLGPMPHARGDPHRKLTCLAALRCTPLSPSGGGSFRAWGPSQRACCWSRCGAGRERLLAAQTTMVLRVLAARLLSVEDSPADVVISSPYHKRPFF